MTQLEESESLKATGCILISHRIVLCTKADVWTAEYAGRIRNPIKPADEPDNLQSWNTTVPRVLWILRYYLIDAQSKEALFSAVSPSAIFLLGQCLDFINMKYNPSVYVLLGDHPSIIYAEFLLRDVGKLDPIPANFRQEEGRSLGRLPINHSLLHSHSPHGQFRVAISFCRRKLGYKEETHAVKCWLNSTVKAAAGVKAGVCAYIYWVLQ